MYNYKLLYIKIIGKIGIKKVLCPEESKVDIEIWVKTMRFCEMKEIIKMNIMHLYMDICINIPILKSLILFQKKQYNNSFGYNIYLICVQCDIDRKINIETRDNLLLFLWQEMWAAIAVKGGKIYWYIHIYCF